jgi:hypothetical protein
VCVCFLCAFVCVWGLCRKSILPDGVPVLSVEASCSYGWDRYSHAHLGVEEFGRSAPYLEVYAHFGITADGVAAKAHKVRFAAVCHRPLPPPPIVSAVGCATACSIVRVYSTCACSALQWAFFGTVVGVLGSGLGWACSVL